MPGRVSIFGVGILLKLFPPKPSGIEIALDDLYPKSTPWPDGEPLLILIPNPDIPKVFGFLKDAKARFKVLDEDNSSREWSPNRRDWIESNWAD